MPGPHWAPRHHPPLQQRFAGLGVRPVASTPQKPGSQLKSELTKWGGVIKCTGARMEQAQPASESPPARCYDDRNVGSGNTNGMTNSAPKKIISLAALANLVPDGASLAVGGSFLHRGPFALSRELARQQRRHLEFIKPSPGYDVDLLCRAGVVTRIRAGIVAMEGNFGLAQWFRRAIERGDAKLEEHA